MNKYIKSVASRSHTQSLTYFVNSAIGRVKGAVHITNCCLDECLRAFYLCNALRCRYLHFYMRSRRHSFNHDSGVHYFLSMRERARHAFCPVLAINHCSTRAHEVLNRKKTPSLTMLFIAVAESSWYNCNKFLIHLQLLNAIAHLHHHHLTDIYLSRKLYIRWENS